MDFLLTKSGAPWLLIEVKLTSSTPDPALHYFAERLGVRHKFLVVAGLDRPAATGDLHIVRPSRAGDVHIFDAPSFFNALPV